ncbi:MAG: biopolymer transporter ExbD [Paludibacteraceae bacterium]|jgi:biopolymer transport protein ExbD|nr:biopolymer transporter ExbD [Paludibacteraceae bacterium]MBO5827530.1 biopolymer transporter ExbD [Paludibacteraceae bacterium]MBQ9100712.1 biopolymer transporter ExbD [Paludibacteraceae bacterium]MBR6658484.1 biopolymer transporter ExbD [Paludibacteraceae bacterium]
MAKKREIQEINASSMADISFLLLIFFLVTTSMATDKGLMRRLPAPVPEEEKKEEEVEINERNMMMILINSNDQLMVNNELMDVRDLKEKAKEFIANPNNSETLPAKKVENIPFFGDIAITKDHVISLQNDRGTSYQAYINVQNELVAAYNELQNDLAKNKFGAAFEDLDDDRKKAIQKVYPQRISEAEPKNYGQQQAAAEGGAQ